MFLKSLKMQGFKSFPEKTVLNFEKGITGVVGPNGSGKSNVSDAVRWVLGEQSSKSLRGSKMEDVIFDGTKSRKAHGFAQVTLTLDNTDRAIESCDSDEISVTRKYFRSGESEYRINGKLVRLKDIHSLFMDTGLGRDGYSMVSQGRIADMISSGGAGCREMLEEASGISAYRYRRTDSIKKLTLAEDNLTRLRDILSELEGRVGPLKIQSDKAKQFLEYSDEKKGLEISLWLLAVEKLKAELKKHDEALRIANMQYKDVVSEIEELSKNIEGAITLSQNATLEIETLRADISVCESESFSYSSKIAVNENSITHNNSVIERVEAEKKATASGRIALEKELETEEKIIAQLNALLDEKKNALSLIEDELKKVRMQGEGIESKARELSQKIADFSSALADERVSLSVATSSVSEIENRLAVVDSLLEGQAELLAIQENQAKKNSAEMTACLEAISAETNRAAGIRMLLDNHEKKLNEIKADISSRTLEISALGSRIHMLEELERDMEGYSGAVKKVLAAGKDGKLKGIDGTVSKLITVSEENALAIETALGNAVQNIVCKTDSDAKRAIEYLKNGNFGRATFQPVSSVIGKVMDEPTVTDCDGFIGIACDLVTCGEEYTNIIENLLGRIVVAEDLDYALAMAKRFSYKFKIVTLDGQVINAGGSLTGGSKAHSSGMISRSIEIKKLNAQLEQKKKELEIQTQKANELQEKFDDESAQIEQIRANIGSLNEEKIRLEGIRQLCSQQLESIRDTISSLEEEKNDSGSRTASAAEQIKQHENEIQRLTVAIDEAENQLKHLNEQQLDFTSQSEKVSSEIVKLRLEIHDCEKDLSVRRQSANLVRARLFEGDDKVSSLDDEIAEIKRKNDEIALENKKYENEIQILANKKSEIENKIKSLQEQRSGFENDTTRLRNEEKEKTSQRETLSGELARLEERLKKTQSEYDVTVSKLYDEYQLSLRQAQSEYSLPENESASKRRLAELKSKIRALGSVNVSAIEEYKEVSERYEFMTSQLADVEKSKRELEKLISELTQNMSGQFREKFAQINEYFNETFRELFGGGSAQIVLLDPTDVLESEIEIKLQPPGKNVKRLDSLSGGEKGLSAVSLLFAILKVNPAPFCIFDEVEAALDDVNVTRYAQYVRRMSDNIQFILITHRRGTMEEADMLYGVTMQEQGVSKLLELKTAELIKELGL